MAAGDLKDRSTDALQRLQSLNGLQSAKNYTSKLNNDPLISDANEGLFSMEALLRDDEIILDPLDLLPLEEVQPRPRKKESTAPQRPVAIAPSQPFKSSRPSKRSTAKVSTPRGSSRPQAVPKSTEPEAEPEQPREFCEQ